MRFLFPFALAFFASFLCGSLHAASPALLPSTESDPEAFAAHCVNVINGDYCEAASDIAINGPDPLFLHRFYNSKNYMTGEGFGGWRFFPEALLVLGKDPHSQKLRAFSGERSGGILAYSGKIGEGLLTISQEDGRGMVNTYAEEINAQTNHRNNRLYCKESACVLVLGDGTRRVFEQTETLSASFGEERGAVLAQQVISPQFFRLISETFPSGNTLYYFYDEEGRLCLVEMKSRADKTHAWIRFTHTFSDHGLFVTAVSSDEKTINYTFEKRGKSYCLTNVESSHGASIAYVYDKQNRLVGKNLPEGQFQQVAYDPMGKVSSLSGAFEGQFVYGEGCTDFFNALGIKTRCLYDKKLQLTAVERFDESDQLYRIDRKYWGESESWGHLLARTVEDGEGNVLSCRSFMYDTQGNVIEEKLYGNLTGKQPVSLSIDAKGRVLFPEQQECHTKTFGFSEDGFNLLTRVGDCKGNQTLYFYQPGTNLLIKKYIYEKDTIKKRLFKAYNEDAVCVQTIEDDGSKEDPSQVKGYGMKERHITRITPKEDLPGVGLPVVIEKSALDLQSMQELLISKEINHYSPQGKKLSCERYDAHGNFAYALCNTYNARGKITSETDPEGNAVFYTYDACGNQTSVSIPSQDRTIEHLYDARNRLIKTIETSQGIQASQSYTYDALGRETSATNRFGQTTSYAYDRFNRLIQTIFPSVIDENGQTVSPIFTYTYDLFGNVLTTTDPKGDVTEKEYTLRGDPTRIYYPDGTFELFKYDTEGSLHRSMTRDKIITVYEYDYLGRVIYKEHSSLTENATASFIKNHSYKYNGFRLLVENEDQKITRYEHDPAGRISAIIEHKQGQKAYSLEARKTEILYDPLGRESKKKVWHGDGPTDYSWECVSRDFLGQTTEKWIEDAEGNRLLERGYRYDSKGQCIEEYTPGQILTKTLYDPFGEPIRHSDASGNETHIFIDYSGSVLKKTIVGPTGVQTLLTFDALGRVVSIEKKDPMGNTLSSQKTLFDPVGNPSVEIQAVLFEGNPIGEQTTRCKYGPMGRLEEKIEAAGAPEQKTTRYAYDQQGKMTSQETLGSAPLIYTYNKKGLLYKVQSEGISNSYSYDRRGNIYKAKSLKGKSVERHYNIFDQMIKEIVKDGEGSYTLSYQYDRKGRLTAIALPDGSQVIYTYDALFGREVKRLSSEGEELYRHTYDCYDNLGRLAEETLIGESGKRDTGYDLDGRKKSMRTDFFSEEVESFNPLGQILEVKKEGERVPEQMAHISYNYNHLSQLTKEPRKSYTYDSLDNCRKEEDQELSYNCLNQLIQAGQASYTYDSQGNLLRKILDGEEVRSYESDPLSQLISIEKSDHSTIQNSYDGFGRRLVKKQRKRRKTLSISRKFYLGCHELGTLDSQGNLLTLRIPGISNGSISQKSIAIEIGQKPYIPLHDITGNLIALIDPISRKIAESYSYTAFGKEEIFNANSERLERSAIGNLWRYAEKPIDEETGLIYFGYRFYDPATHQWTSPDPLYDGPNPYAYLHNNPINAFDRFGLSTEKESSKFETYFYGEVEPHCFCERHRTCKRGGDIGKTDTSRLPKTTYCEHFEALYPKYAPSKILNLGLPEQEDIGIGFVNGVWSSEEDAREGALYLSKMANGCNIHLAYNATHGKIGDLKECKYGLDYIATEPVHQLHRMWNSFFEKNSASAKFLMICHSQGAIHVRNALLDYPPELRERILVVAIAPGAYMYEETCAQVVHYRAEIWRDFIPYIDQEGAKRVKDTVVTLRSHRKAGWFDHEFQSPTWEDALSTIIRKYIRTGGKKI